MIKKRHRDISEFSKVKYFRDRIKSQTWLEESSSPQDTIPSHSKDFITITCQPYFPRNMLVSHWLVDKYLLSFQGRVGSSTLGSLHISLHQTLVCLYRKATNRKSECTMLQNLIRGHCMRMQEQKPSTIISLRSVNRKGPSQFTLKEQGNNS